MRAKTISRLIKSNIVQVNKDMGIAFEKCVWMQILNIGIIISITRLKNQNLRKYLKFDQL